MFVDNAALSAEPLLDGFDYRQTEPEMKILVLALLRGFVEAVPYFVKLVLSYRIAGVIDADPVCVQIVFNRQLNYLLAADIRHGV